MLKDGDIDQILPAVIIDEVVDIKATGFVAKKTGRDCTIDRLCADRLRPALGQVDAFAVFLKLEQRHTRPLQEWLRKQHGLRTFGCARGAGEGVALLNQQECRNAGGKQHHQQGSDDRGSVLLVAHHRPAGNVNRRVYCSPDDSVIDSSSADGK